MRRAHESLLVLGGGLLALAPFLYYVSYLAVIPGIFCLLGSLACGIAHLRRCLPAGAVGVRSHLTYFVVAASLAGIFAPGFEALCCPTAEHATENPALYATTALTVLCSLCVIPFALARCILQSRNGGALTPRRRSRCLFGGRRPQPDYAARH